jgi:hypothetical protein
MVIGSQKLRMGLGVTLLTALLHTWTACGTLVGIEELATAPPDEPLPMGTCRLPTDCPLAGNGCFLRSCVGGLCALTDAPAGTPVASQVAGDCKQVQCDAVGNTVEAPANDPFDDGSDCTQDFCAGPSVEHNPVQARTPCQKGVCNGAGACVGCIDTTDCTGTDECDMNKCVPPTCTDNMPNGQETALDCGGPQCNPCGDGATCAVGTDCLSKVCANDLTCAAATCSDGVTNGDETDMDCGGGCAIRCADSKLCEQPEDCMSGVCGGEGPAPVCLPPTCIDGVTNGTEVAPDCGPDCEGKCDVGEPCTAPGQCGSQVCTEGFCAEPACNDGVHNGSEMGIDCGGECPNMCD